MIWYEQELQCRDQPDQVTITLTGMYNPPGSMEYFVPPLPTILIRLAIETGPDDTLILKILFKKSPTTLAHEEPTGDDVLAKYLPIILRLVDKVQNATYPAIIAWP